jgi:hypothetical protein
MGLVGISPTSKKPAVSGGLAKSVGGGLDAASVFLAATLDYSAVAVTACVTFVGSV